GEEPSEVNKLPKVEANIDEGKTTQSSLTAQPEENTVIPSAVVVSLSPETSSSPSTLNTEAGANTSSAPSTAATPASEERYSTTEKIEETTEEGSGEAAIEGGIVPKLEANADEKSSTEPAFVTSGRDMERPTTSNPADSLDHFSSSRPLDSSSVNKTTSSAPGNEGEEFLINRTLIDRDRPHNINLPVNVGFVPGSEPDSMRESEEEEGSEKTDTQKEPDYEDTTTTKNIRPTNATTAFAGT
ncbi:unnamed protein product, partial [Strongylus vulgaris]